MFNSTQMEMINSVGRMMLEDGVKPEMLNKDLISAYFDAYTKAQEKMMNQYFARREEVLHTILDAMGIN